MYLRIKIRFVLLLLLALLTGCGPADVTPPAEDGIVVLWHAFTGSEAEALQALTDRFNAENPWDLVLITEYQRDILEKLLATTPDHHPDLVVGWPEDLEAYLQHGLVAAGVDLPFAERQEGNDLLPMAEALYTVNGQVQALPLGLAAYVVYYNSDWLSDLGYNAATATWEDLRRTACAATEPLGGQIGLGLPAQPSVLLALLASGGSTILGEDGQYHFADAAGVGTATVINEILSGACGIVYEDRDAGVIRLSNSSLAMTVESSLRLPEVQQAVTAGRNFALGIGALPGPAGPGPTFWYGPGMMLIAPAGARRDAASHVLGWFFSPEAQADWSAATDYLPVRRSLIEERLAEEAGSADESLLRITLDAADNGAWVVWPRYTNTMACRASLLRGLLSLGGQTLPGAYIEAAATACNTGIRSPMPAEATPEENP